MIWQVVLLVWGMVAIIIAFLLFCSEDSLLWWSTFFNRMLGRLTTPSLQRSVDREFDVDKRIVRYRWLLAFAAVVSGLVMIFASLY